VISRHIDIGKTQRTSRANFKVQYPRLNVQSRGDGSPMDLHPNSSSTMVNSSSNRSLKPYRSSSRSARRSIGDVGVRTPAGAAPRTPATIPAVLDDLVVDRRRCPALAILWYRRLLPDWPRGERRRRPG